MQCQVGSTIEQMDKALLKHYRFFSAGKENGQISFRSPYLMRPKSFRRQVIEMARGAATREKQNMFQNSLRDMRTALGITPAGALERIKMAVDLRNPLRRTKPKPTPSYWQQPIVPQPGHFEELNPQDTPGPTCTYTSVSFIPKEAPAPTSESDSFATTFPPTKTDRMGKSLLS